MTLTIAFYKGRADDPWGRVKDWAIRKATGGKYSHAELIEGRADLGAQARCLSASSRDGGVREKTIHLTPGHWDLVEMPIDPAEAADFIRQRIGMRYDWRGVFLSQVLAFGGHSKRRWFCSEIIAAALNMERPNRISPQMLFDILAYTSH